MASAERINLYDEQGRVPDEDAARAMAEFEDRERTIERARSLGSRLAIGILNKLLGLSKNELQADRERELTEIGEGVLQTKEWKRLEAEAAAAQEARQRDFNLFIAGERARRGISDDEWQRLSREEKRDRQERWRGEREGSPDILLERKIEGELVGQKLVLCEIGGRSGKDVVLVFENGLRLCLDLERDPVSGEPLYDWVKIKSPQ